MDGVQRFEKIELTQGEDERSPSHKIKTLDSVSFRYSFSVFTSSSMGAKGGVRRVTIGLTS